MQLAKMYPGVHLWFYSFVIGTLMYFLIALRTKIPDFFSYFTVNVLIGAVATLRFAGIRQFFGKTTHPILYGFPVLYGVFTIYFYFFDNNNLGRTIAGAMVQDVVIGEIVYLLFKNAKKGLRLVFSVTGIVFMLYFAVVTVRVVVALFNPHIAVLVNTNLFNILLFISLLATDMAWGTVFFSVNSYRMRKELEDANKNQTKLYSYIAHDLRGPIGGLVSSIDQLSAAREKLSPAAYRELLMQLTVNTKNVFFLLENLLLWGRNQTDTLLFSPAVIDVQRLVDEALSGLTNQSQLKNIDLLSAVPSGLEIIGDRRMLLAVLQNLAGNALKFNHDGGQVSVHVEADAVETRFSVTDDGIGMEPAALAALLSGTGTAPGLGLVLCREFIQYHRGRFWAESTVGKGSIFSFNIPRKT